MDEISCLSSCSSRESLWSRPNPARHLLLPIPGGNLPAPCFAQAIGCPQGDVCEDTRQEDFALSVLESAVPCALICPRRYRVPDEQDGFMIVRIERSGG